jgi:hypothetical protein
MIFQIEDAQICALSIDCTSHMDHRVTLERCIEIGGMMYKRHAGQSCVGWTPEARSGSISKCRSSTTIMRTSIGYTGSFSLEEADHRLRY